MFESYSQCLKNVCASCKGDVFVIDAGYETCVSCGNVQRKELNENACSFDYCPTHSLRTAYSRIKRFNNKILGGLQRKLHHKLDEEVFHLLKERTPEEPVSPEQFLDHLTSLVVGRRKPYIHAIYYYEARYKVALPKIPEHEELMIGALFREIFYANDRLKLKRPTFPMATLLRLTVDHFEFSLATQLVVRFAKRLRCERRRRRYTKMFEKCLLYINKDERTRSAIAGLRRKKVAFGGVGGKRGGQCEGIEAGGTQMAPCTTHYIGNERFSRQSISDACRDAESREKRNLQFEQDNGYQERKVVFLMREMMMHEKQNGSWSTHNRQE